MKQYLESTDMMGNMHGAAFETHRSADARIAPSAAAVVGETVAAQLRGMYQDVVSYPAPDSFLTVLRRLDDA